MTYYVGKNILRISPTNFFEWPSALFFSLPSIFFRTFPPPPASTASGASSAT